MPHKLVGSHLSTDNAVPLFPRYRHKDRYVDNLARDLYGLNVKLRDDIFKFMATIQDDVCEQRNDWRLLRNKKREEKRSAKKHQSSVGRTIHTFTYRRAHSHIGE
jgi:hypothetical protein